jgi:hypothetical protein
MKKERWPASALFCSQNAQIDALSLRATSYALSPLPMSQSESPSPPKTEAVPIMIGQGEYWRRKWGRKLIIWGIPCVLGLVLMGVFGSKGIESLKVWRARKLVDFAAVQKKSGNAAEAKNLLLQAFALTRSDIVVLRAMAEDYASSPSEALQFLQVVALSKDAAKDDRLKLCRVALETRLLSYASAEFEKMLQDPTSKEDSEMAELCARYLTLQGQAKKALEWTKSQTAGPDPKAGGGPAKNQQVSPPGQNARLNLVRAKLLLDAVQPDEASMKRTADEVTQLILAAIKNGSKSEEREAVLLLSRLVVTLAPVRECVGAEGMQDLSVRLKKFADEPGWEAKLVEADLEISLKPESKVPTLERLTEEAKTAEESSRLELARWLNIRGEPERSQKLAESDPAQLNKRDWFLIRLDAMAAEKKWKEIESVLLEPKGVPIEEILGRLFLWRCAKELGKPAAEIEASRARILEAGKKQNSGPDFFAAGYLEKMGDRETAAAIYQKYVADESMSGPAFVGLVRCIGADPKKTSALRDTLEKMLAKYPHLSEAKNDLAYLNLLESKKIKESVQAAAMLVTDSPQVLAYRTTMALAELVQGNLKEAESVYRGVEVDWAKVSPGWAAVRACVLGANGKNEEARRIVSVIRADALREGERALLDRFVKDAR